MVDKPAGWTSHDVVAVMRKRLGIKRIGHAGTLDPAATGLLPLCVGRATRIVEYLVDLPKTYRARMKLGEETDTEDGTGRVVQTRQIGNLSPAAVRSVILGFLGDSLQIPPMYAALKVDGRRLYEYAREGDEILREPRPIHLYAITDIVVDLPYADFLVRCSRGTYIRSLCRDMGRELGVGSHLVALRRTESASFGEADAQPLDRLMDISRTALYGLLIPMDRPLNGFEAVIVRPKAATKVCHGQGVTGGDLRGLPDPWPAGGMVRLYGEDGTFLALGEAVMGPLGEPYVRPKKVLCQKAR
ncbi:MAG: tRNA pseudouridine(55) synthase TruB [bacterium]|nr:tRNA pseudouridine(55) synthase TruB [bacterium]